MEDKDRAQLLINFVEVAAKGMVKPFDATAILSKLADLERNGVDISSVANCCPQQTEVRDTNNLRAYIIGACDELTKILKFTKQGYNEYGSRN